MQMACSAVCATMSLPYFPPAIGRRLASALFTSAATTLQMLFAKAAAAVSWVTCGATAPTQQLKCGAVGRGWTRVGNGRPG